MADNNISSSDFDKMLDDFIAAQLQDTEDQLAELNAKNSDTSAQPAPQPEEDTEEISVSEIIGSIEDSSVAKLAAEEKALFNAFCGFTDAVKACGEAAEVPVPEFFFTAEDLLPRFRPSRTNRLNNDILAAWSVLIKAQPVRLSSLPDNASDEQILSFAEKTSDKNLQNALLSYVETLIEIDSCEIAYNLRKVKYQRYKIEKKIFEEQQIRREKIHQYIEAVRAGNFPVDAERLINNFFKTVRKDPEGAKKMLETNPATFAPIQVDKIPARFFVMIKPKQEDGIKINKKLGKFLKKLKA